MRIYAIIPAGGKGTRSGFKTPKQYIKIYGKELIAYTLDVFNKNRSVDEIIIAADPFYFKTLINICAKYGYSKVTKIVQGGKERQDSVYNALKLIEAEPDDLIIVHDAARALLPNKVLNNAIKKASELGNALVCIKAKDTLLIGNESVKNYLDRDKVFYVQTPQIFKYSILMKAFENAYKKKQYGTDESMLVKNIKQKVYLSEGSSYNFKITSKEDIELFKKIIQAQKIKS